MTDVIISVMSDPESSTGGGAILRLTGVALVPPGSTFRIDPIDDDGATNIPEGWPAGDLKPGGQRITKDGVDLVLGADVVESAALMPGTPVTISVPAVGARTELRWPSLPVARPERRPAVVVSGEQRAAELAARTAADQAEAKLLKEKAALEAGEAAALSRLSLTPETTASPTETQPAEPPGPDPLAKLKPIPAPIAPPARSQLTPEPTKPELLKPKPAMPAPAPASKTVAPPGTAASAIAQRAAGAKPLDAGPSAGPPRRRSFWIAAALPFALGCIFAGTVAVVFPAIQQRPVSGVSKSPAGALPSHAAAIVGDRTGAFAAPRLAEILAVSEMSPAGEAAAGVTLEEALQRADRSLYGENRDKDRLEAKFWLRKALSLGLGDERLLWAMTQLGTLYATPDGSPPDYASARMLWELAAAKGDPIALCFLASVTENGLGAPKDARRALALYEQAKARGGCRDIDDAITRLKKAAP